MVDVDKMMSDIGISGITNGPYVTELRKYLADSGKEESYIHPFWGNVTIGDEDKAKFILRIMWMVDNNRVLVLKNIDGYMSFRDIPDIVTDFFRKIVFEIREFFGKRNPYE